MDGLFPCSEFECLRPDSVAAIIGREIAMSALREWAASLGSEAHKAVAVSPLGKWKTTTQVSCPSVCDISQPSSWTVMQWLLIFTGSKHPQECQWHLIAMAAVRLRVVA